MPCLDAVIEESNRKSTSGPSVGRKVLVNTVVLDHMVCKDTEVIVLNIGGDSVEPPSGPPTPEHLRRESSRAAAKACTTVSAWDPNHVQEFKPLRRLAKDEEGKEVFNAQAGPTLAFGLGPRGYFGRKMAYLKLRIVVVLILWEFEPLDVPAHWNASKDMLVS